MSEREEVGVEFVEIVGGPFDGMVAKVAPGSTEVRARESEKPCDCCTDMMIEFAYRPPGYPEMEVEEGQVRYLPSPMQEPGKRRRFIVADPQRPGL